MTGRLEALAAAMRDERLPAAVVDVDLFDANARRMLDLRRRDVPLRVASKSVRVPALIERVLGIDGYRGVLGFDPEESAWLAARLPTDVVLAYPAMGAEVEALARAGGNVAAMVDDVAQVEALGDAATRASTIVPIWLDVDVTLRVAGLHLGVRRSPLRDADGAIAVADAVKAHPSLRLDGVMAYEAAVAGLPDHTPGSAWLDPVRRLVKRRSSVLARTRRAEVVAALRSRGHRVDVVNGGGTGSIGSTSEDPVVTELTVGSGLFCPHQFDRYDGLGLDPACFVALRVTRRSDDGFVTVAGGGFVASGAGPAKSPIVAWPPGVRATSDEGWGEVQTPLHVPAGVRLVPGDVVLVRHAKAGEPMAHLRDVVLASDGRILNKVATYRGIGLP